MTTQGILSDEIYTTAGNGLIYNCELVSYANLTNTNLLQAELAYTDLSNANLSNANLKQTDLISADFSNANISGTNMLLSYSKDAKFNDVIITLEE